MSFKGDITLHSSKRLLFLLKLHRHRFKTQRNPNLARTSLHITQCNSGKAMTRQSLITEGFVKQSINTKCQKKDKTSTLMQYTRKLSLFLPWSHKCTSPCSQFLDTPHRTCMCWCRTGTGLCPGHQNLEDQSQQETWVTKCFSIRPSSNSDPSPIQGRS